MTTSPNNPSVQTADQTTPARSGLAPLEVAAITLLGVVSLLGVSGMLMSFLPNADTGQLNLAMLPACLGMVLAGLSSAAMIWLRNRNRSVSTGLALGILLWFGGVNILGWGGFAVINPGEQTVAAKLIISIVLCFMPGGILTLAGLMIYNHNRRQGSQTAEVQAGGVRLETDKLQRAAEYRAHIIELIQQKRGSAFADQLTSIPARLEQWELHLRRLVDKLNNFETNRILQRDLRDVPAAITRLQQQLEIETDAEVRAQMAKTLADYQAQQRQLETLASMMRRIGLEIEETLAEIGTVYSQLQLLGVKEIDDNRARRLSTEIDEQVNRLDDLLAAMDEVHYDNKASFKNSKQ